MVLAVLITKKRLIVFPITKVINGTFEIGCNGYVINFKKSPVYKKIDAAKISVEMSFGCLPDTRVNTQKVIP